MACAGCSAQRVTDVEVGLVAESLCSEDVRAAVTESEAVQQPLLAVLTNAIRLAGEHFRLTLAADFQD